MSKVLQAVDSIHQVGIYCLALVPPNYLPRGALGGIHIQETKRKLLEGSLHPANVLMCPHTCVLNLPQVRSPSRTQHCYSSIILTMCSRGYYTRLCFSFSRSPLLVVTPFHCCAAVAVVVVVVVVYNVSWHTCVSSFHLQLLLVLLYYHWPPSIFYTVTVYWCVTLYSSDWCLSVYLGDIQVADDFIISKSVLRPEVSHLPSCI